MMKLKSKSIFVISHDNLCLVSLTYITYWHMKQHCCLSQHCTTFNQKQWDCSEDKLLKISSYLAIRLCSNFPPVSQPCLRPPVMSITIITQCILWRIQVIGHIKGFQEPIILLRLYFLKSNGENFLLQKEPTVLLRSVQWSPSHVNTKTPISSN